MIGGDYTLREMSTQALDHPRFKLVFECGILTPEAPMQNRAVCHNTGVHRVDYVSKTQQYMGAQHRNGVRLRPVFFYLILRHVMP
jgi:hypothetical protein